MSLSHLIDIVALIQFTMARARRRAVANKSTQSKKQKTHKCPLCTTRFFMKLATRNHHMRKHDMRSHGNTPSIAPPSNNLLSRQAPDDVVIFNFNANVEDKLAVEDELNDIYECNDASNIDSYYSDSNFEKEFLTIQLGDDLMIMMETMMTIMPSTPTMMEMATMMVTRMVMRMRMTMMIVMTMMRR